MAYTYLPSPLRTRLFISRTALDLAGGRAALLALFASRLGAWRRDPDQPPVVSSFGDRVWRRLPVDGPHHVLIIRPPRDITPPVNVEAVLETSDTRREIFPDQDDPDFVPDDPLLEAHHALAALMRDWPEMAPRLGTVPRRPRR